MKKVRKGKKMLISLIAIVAIIVVVFAIVAITKAVKKNKENQSQEGQETAISLPDTTYSDMEVKNIYMEYLKDEDKTMVSMSILNTTDKKVEDESLNAILIGSDENVLGQMQTWIQSLDVGEQYDISVILNGNLTGTKVVKLEKVTTDTQTPEEQFL